MKTKAFDRKIFREVYMTSSAFPNNPPQQTVAINSSDYVVVGAGVLNGEVSFLSIQLANNGPGTVSSFKIQVQLFPNGPWFDYLGDSDFGSTSESIMIKASSLGINATTNGGTSYAIVRLDGCYAMQFLAMADQDNTSVVVSWYARRQRSNAF
jgi:hypothetical protein